MKVIGGYELGLVNPAAGGNMNHYLARNTTIWLQYDGPRHVIAAGEWTVNVTWHDYYLVTGNYRHLNFVVHELTRCLGLSGAIGLRIARQAPFCMRQ